MNWRRNSLFSMSCRTYSSPVSIVIITRFVLFPTWFSILDIWDSEMYTAAFPKV